MNKIDHQYMTSEEADFWKRLREVQKANPPDYDAADAIARELYANGTRWQNERIEAMIEDGATVNKIRAEYDLPPLEGCDVPFDQNPL